MFLPAFRPSGNFPFGVFAALLFLEATAISTFILCLVALDLSSLTRDPLLPPVISWCFGPLSSSKQKKERERDSHCLIQLSYAL